MDEEQKQGEINQPTVETQTESSSSPSVSFPSIPTSDGKSKKGLILLIISILAILGILGFFIFRGSQTAESTPTPLPTVEGVSTTPSPEATSETVDKSKIKIEIQNGTGISGEAAFLQTQLKNLGYSDFKVGNAQTQDVTNTTITYGKSAPQSVMDEITKKLEELYKKVEVKNSTTQATDVLIVTGLRKGATAKPSPSPTAKATATGTPKPTTTGSPTSTPTASASPTATP